MKNYKLTFNLVDGSNATTVMDENKLGELQKGISDRGFDIIFLIPDGIINLNHVTCLIWKEEE
jgi:hypothetical protein